MKNYKDPYIIIQRFGTDSVVTSSGDQFENWANANPDAKNIDWANDLNNVLDYEF